MGLWILGFSASTLCVRGSSSCFTHMNLFEPQGQKPYLQTCAPSEDSDQPAHSRSLIRIFTGRMLDSQGCKVSPCGTFSYVSVHFYFYVRIRLLHSSTNLLSTRSCGAVYVRMSLICETNLFVLTLKVPNQIEEDDGLF